MGERIGNRLKRVLVVGLVLTPLLSVRTWVLAQNSGPSAWVVRRLQTSEYGVTQPQGLTFSTAANSFLIVDQQGQLTLVGMYEEPAGSLVLPQAQGNPLNVAFDEHTGSLFVLQEGKSELAQIQADGRGVPQTGTGSRGYALQAFGIQAPRGIAFGSQDGRLFILDAGSSQIVSVQPDPSRGFDGGAARVERLALKQLGRAGLQGIAYNPANGHLYVGAPQEKRLYELSPGGDLLSTFDLAGLGISQPLALTFAPSVDATDDPGIYDLFVLDAGPAAQTAKTTVSAQIVSAQQLTSPTAQIVEISLQTPAALPNGTSLLPASLVRTFDTSIWSNPSPDPSGIEYWPATGKFLISDSEIEESVGGHPPVYWNGYNVFYSTLAGNLVGNCTTFTSDPVSLAYNNFSNEPTGVAVNPNNNHLFFSNDGANGRLFEVSPGSDGQYCSSDDIVTRRLVATLYGATDAEDVTYGNNTLFLSDGINAEVYKIPLGADGVMSDDDGPVTHFDTAALGFHDLEGIYYNQDSGTLFIVSTQGSENYLGEVTTSGNLIRAYDLSFMGTAGNIRSSVVYAPSSQNPAVKNIYIASRGIDNNSNRNENDGRVWEISLGNSQPTLTATATNTASPTATATPTKTATPIGGLPGKVTLIAPSGAISTKQPTYTWNANNAATYYYLWINDSSGNVFNQWYQGSSICGGSTCSVTPSKTLSAGNYTWWVQTWNSAGYGPWSDAMYFAPTVPGTAGLVSPNGNIGTNFTPTYTWNKVSDATWYYLWVNGPSGNVIQQWYEASSVCSGNSCSVTPARSLSSGTHTWWIQTWNEVGYGPWSASMNFTTTVPAPPGATSLVSPSGTIGQTTPTYTWSKVSSATWYYLWVNGPSGNVIKQWYDAAVVCGASTCSAMPTTALSAGNYIFWVQTWNPGGYGPWSPSLNFAVSP